MYWQQRYLKDTAQPEGHATGLETIDLPRSGLLSGIEFRFWGTPGSTTGSPDCWFHDFLTKIEVIVNGSKVVKSFEGTQLVADMLYKKTPLYGHGMKNNAGTSAEEFFYINFGRFYHDLDYMLDLSKVNDPELRLTYNFDLTGHDGWTTKGEALAATPYYSVIPHIVRDYPGAPKGYIKTSEVYRFTSGNSKKENMKLPIGPVYANLYLQCFYKSHGLGYDVDKVELNINNDAIIPFRVGVLELEAEIVRKYGLFEISQEVYLTGGQAYPFPLEVGEFFGRSAEAQDALLAGGDLWACFSTAQYTVLSTQLAGTGSIFFFVTSRGAFPFSVAAIPIFDLEDERTWINSAVLGDLWLRVEESSSAASSTVKLLADEVVTAYPD